MPTIKEFDFFKYDKGGANAAANDNKLTGEEVEEARKDGWTVWDDFCSEDSALPEYVENNNETKQAEMAFKIYNNSRKSESYKQYEKRVNEILVKILSEKYNITLTEEDYYGKLSFTELHYDDRYIEALQEAKAQAKKELKLSDNAFGSGIIINKPLTGIKLPDNWGYGFGRTPADIIGGPRFPSAGPDRILPIITNPKFPDRVGGIGRYIPTEGDIPGWTVPNLPIGIPPGGYYPPDEILPVEDEPFDPPAIDEPNHWDEEYPWEDEIPDEPDPWNGDDPWDDEPWEDEPPTAPVNQEPPNPSTPPKPNTPPAPSQPVSPPPAPTSPAPNNPTSPATPGGIQYHPPTNNPKRAESPTKGDFCTGWIEKDAYGSSSFEDWLSNNGYKFDSSAAGNLCKYAEQKSADGAHYGKCGVAFREAAEKAGLWGNTQRNNSAYQFASALSKNPNFKELPHNIVMSMDLRKLPAGCVIVYDAGYRDDGRDHPDGHISVTVGDGTEYGGGWKDENGHHTTMRIHQEKKNDHIRVFIPVVKK